MLEAGLGGRYSMGISVVNTEGADIRWEIPLRGRYSIGWQKIILEVQMRGRYSIAGGKINTRGADIQSGGKNNTRGADIQSRVAKSILEG